MCKASNQFIHPMPQGVGARLRAPPFISFPTIGCQVHGRRFGNPCETYQRCMRREGGSAMRLCTMSETLTDPSYTTDSRANTRIDLFLFQKVSNTYRPPSSETESLVGFQFTVDAWKSLQNVPKMHASGGGIRNEALHELRRLDRSLLHDRLTRKHKNSNVLIAKCVKYLPSTKIGNRLASRFLIHCRRLKIFAKHTKPFVLACILLYPVCTPLVPLGMLVPKVFFGTPFVLLCIRVCSVCIRLYRSGCRFPSSFCTPFVFVCTPTPFDEYNIIRNTGGVQKYKSVQICSEHCTGCPLATRDHYGTRRCRGAVCCACID